MKRILLSIIFLIIIAFVIIFPWLEGNLFKYHYTKVLSIIGADNRVQIKILNYHVGWFSSDAKISVQPVRLDVTGLAQLPNAFSNDNTVAATFIIDQHISHGPIVYDYAENHWKFAEAGMQGFIHAPSLVESVLLGNNQNQGVVQINSIATFTGDYINHIDTPVFNVSLPTGAKFAWQGLHGIIVLNVARDHINQVKTDINIGSLSASANQFSFGMQGIEIHEDIVRQLIGLWEGRYSLFMPQLSIEDPSLNVKLTQFNVATQFATENSEYYNTNLQASMDSLITPDFTIQPAHIKMSLNNLSAQGLVDVINESYLTIKENPRLLEDPERMNQWILHTLTPKTVFNADMTLNSSYGNIVLNSSAHWPENTPLPTTIQELWEKSSAKLNLRFSISLMNKFVELSAKKQATELSTAAATNPTITQPTASPTDLEQKAHDQLQQQVNLLVKEGFLIQDKDDYVMDIIHENGVTKINGKDIPK